MTRTWTVRTLGLVVGLAGLWTAFTQQPPAQPLTIEAVASDLHVIVGSGGNVAVLTTSEGAILVDDKFERNVPEILANVKKVTDQPVRYVLNTHQHGDHTGGNQALMGQNVEILVHRNARANMAAAKQPGQPRLTFSDEAAVNLGGKEVRARHFGRGHTNGDAVIYFPAHRVVHTGDLFVDGAPFIDYSAGGSGVAWTSTLKEVLKLDFDKVIPGHGAVMTKQNLADWVKSFETVRERLGKLKREGKSKEEAQKLLVVTDLPGWGSDRMWGRSYPGLYDELP